MAWWGKVLGGTFGFMVGGPLGALLGAVLGHQFDRGMRHLALDNGGDQEAVQTAFFTATFSVMGHVAKADGRVSKDEIAYAEGVMGHMALAEDQRAAAIGLFREGKAADFPLEEVIDQFRAICGRRRLLLQMFLEVQLQAAYADGRLDAAERQLLLRICERLGFSPQVFAHLEAMVRAAGHFTGDGAGTGAGFRPEPARRDLLREAYEILDVDAGAADAEVKRAYRRLMNQHHPDKLVAKGLPEEMVKLATEKTQEIKNAYEMVKKARGMR